MVKTVLTLAAGLGMATVAEGVETREQAEFLEENGCKVIQGYLFSQAISGGDFAQYMSTPWLMHVQRFLLLFSSMNLAIAVFNLLPIPPLDGFHVLNDLILKGKLTMNAQFFQIAQIVLLMLVFSGALGTVLSTVTGAIEGGVLHLFLLLEGAA